MNRYKKLWAIPIIRGALKFIMGHDIGKIEIIGRVEDKLILKHIHSRLENPKEASKVKIMKLTPNAGWLDDMEETTYN
jgi:hypothetical protein